MTAFLPAKSNVSAGHCAATMPALYPASLLQRLQVEVLHALSSLLAPAAPAERPAEVSTDLEVHFRIDAFCFRKRQLDRQP